MPSVPGAHDFGFGEIMTYEVPGLLTLAAYCLVQPPQQVVPELVQLHQTVLAALALVAGYFLGHLVQAFTTYIRKLVAWACGAPVPRLLAGEPQGKIAFMRGWGTGYPEGFRVAVLASLESYWELPRRSTPFGQYYALCEALLEHECPSIWAIHHRFTRTANLLRGVVVPAILLGAALAPRIPWAPVPFGMFALAMLRRSVSFDFNSARLVFDGFYSTAVGRSKRRAGGGVEMVEYASVSATVVER